MPIPQTLIPSGLLCKKSRLQTNVLFEILHKLARHALFAPIHTSFFRRPECDGSFMDRDELAFETLEF